jgi:hypothetical protein
VLHISSLERNQISINNMSDVGLYNLCQKDTCKMGKGVMVLMKGFRIRTLYKLLGNVDSNRCNNIVVLEVNLTQLKMSRYKST